MAKLNSDNHLETLQRNIADHRRQLNTLLFRVEDLEAAMDDARQRERRQRELMRRKRAR